MPSADAGRSSRDSRAAHRRAAAGGGAAGGDPSPTGGEAGPPHCGAGAGGICAQGGRRYLRYRRAAAGYDTDRRHGGILRVGGAQPGGGAGHGVDGAEAARGGGGSRGGGDRGCYWRPPLR
eukprot:CAMPEP_0172176268 /NCGR_PEP_ID=MMETSP1050-20130122/14703_1 /TAXON_ID=233186 /ORGANISM="Cryptomonas curvata, Strain CCAP979/52" /LENGTH=120 /DNA_ID=CAMNT_0012848491 /DNA_START=1035 /DNA_END=1393 /DNA_ORIENTATION=+